LQAGGCQSLRQLLSLQAGGYESLGQLKHIQKEACWAVSNIAAGSSNQIQEVVNSGLIPPIIDLLSTGDYDIKKEVVCVITNLAASENLQHIEYLVQSGCIKPLVEMLRIPDVKVTLMVLQALENMLGWGKSIQLQRMWMEDAGLGENPVVALIEQADGIAEIEALQEDRRWYSSEAIYNKATKILEMYFLLECEMNDVIGSDGFVLEPQIQIGAFNFCGVEPQSRQESFLERARRIHSWEGGGVRGVLSWYRGFLCCTLRCVIQIPVTMAIFEKVRSFEL